MQGPIGVTFKGNGGHGDGRKFRKPLFQIVIFRLTLSESDPPVIVMDDDRDVIRIVEGQCAAIERRVVELPLRRRRVPHELHRVVPVFVVPGPAAFRGKVKLVPKLELGLRWQRNLAGFLAADQIPAHGDEGLAPIRPEDRDDVGRSSAQSNPARMAFWIFSASINAMTSTASTACWPFRNVSLERKRVVP